MSPAASPSPKTPPMVRMDAVQKRFTADGEAPPVEVLRGADLEIAPAERVAIVGPSGSGKSTILNLIGALDRPDNGRVVVDAQDLSALDDAALARFRNRTVGFVFQAHHLLSHCTVWENVLVPALAEASAVDAATEERARRLLKRVGLGDRLGHRPGQLSGGERQRAAVVRALINEPRLLLADEPTGALDRASASSLAHLLLELNEEQHLTLVLVTHAPDLARQMGRVLELRDGTLHPAG